MLASILIFNALGLSADAAAKIGRMRCEQAINPIGIGTTAPRLDWIIESTDRGQMQSAYQVLVSSRKENLEAGKADVWNSGKVKSGESTNVVYGGKPLRSRTRYWWKVRIWDKNGKPSPYSRAAFWEMGLLKSQDWKAKWIESSQELSEGQSPYLRKYFALSGKVKRARLYSTALGLYEVYINSKRVSNDVFAPGWTEYKKKVQYQTYDVTNILKSGGNAIGIVLGDGWYCGHVGAAGRNLYGSTPKALCQLLVEYENGTSQIICTDSTWKTHTGPIVESDMLMGETYDARLEIGNWCENSFNDSQWQQVTVANDVNISLDAQRGPSVRRTGYLKAKSVSEPKNGVYVFDLGQNMVGWARLKVKGAPGTEVVLHFAEVLSPDGTAFTKNYRSAKCTDKYILKGGTEEVYEPHFTYRGFRYVEVSGYPGKPSADVVTGVVVNSDMPVTGKFECSNAMVNQLHSNIAWGERGNYLSVPTDCPQRDERLGWTGDAQVFVRTAAFNMDVQSFYNKWLLDLDQDAQLSNGVFPKVAPNIKGPVEGIAAWGDAGVICPWTIYLCYGDKRVISDNYAAMQKWIDYCEQNSKDLLRPNSGYGDWVSYNANTPKDVIATAYFAYSTHLLAKMAAAIGKYDDSRKYNNLFGEIKSAFNSAYVSPDAKIKGETQTCYALALYFDLLPQDKRALAAQHLVDDIAARDWHLSTGFVGTGYLLPALSSCSMDDAAYKLILQDTLPSWGYQIKRGATTMWELWDGIKESGSISWQMNSFNHYAFGSVGEWIHGNIAGINPDPDKPGYKHIIIRPKAGGGLSYSKASLYSGFGNIACNWRIAQGKHLLHVTIPANTTATVYIPASNPSHVTEGGKPIYKAKCVKFVGMSSGSAVYEVGSGDYDFVSY